MKPPGALRPLPSHIRTTEAEESEGRRWLPTSGPSVQRSQVASTKLGRRNVPDAVIAEMAREIVRPVLFKIEQLVDDRLDDLEQRRLRR